MSEKTALIPIERVERRILLIRGQKVMLDFDLAELYEVEARVLNQSVKRNIERFPEDFMFQLSAKETALVMRSQIVTAAVIDSSQTVMSSNASACISTDAPPANWSQIVTSSKKHRGLAYRPYAFTEQGVAMLSGVLNSPRAVLVNIAIMRTFVQLREMLSSNADLARKLEALEKKYDTQFKVVFDAIRQLMEPVVKKKPKRKIGFDAIMNDRGAKATARSRIRISA